MSRLNQRITQARRARALSQANLAERLGVTRTAISHWETGRSNPSTKHLKSIAKVLGIDASWLISGKGLARAFINGINKTDFSIFNHFTELAYT